MVFSTEYETHWLTTNYVPSMGLTVSIRDFSNCMDEETEAQRGVGEPVRTWARA